MNAKEIAKKFRAFETADKEYVAALLKKTEWYDRESRDIDEQLGICSYPYDYEITQWELKRELAHREINSLVKEIENSI